MTSLVTSGAFKTIDILKIGKPKTTDADGPAGFVVFMGDPSVYGTGYFCCETLIAATFNVDLAFAMGEAVGNEGLLGDMRKPEDAVPYSGWYAPGINIHRSQFGGRNGEYFSEDGFLAGKLAASEIQGAASKGVYCYPKHFAANEQETNRAGICTWVTEQALREIYFKPFELAVKDGKVTAMMSSFNRIGTTWAGGDYRLLTEVLREEWGFNGMVISDFNTNSHMDGRQMIYAGGDLNLRTVSGGAVYSPSPSSATDVVVLRKAVKNILYTTNNSNIMNVEVLGYNLAWWQVFLIVLDVVAVAGFAVWGFFAVRKALKNDELN